MVARLNRLSARGVAALTKPGRHADGGNLYLNVTKSGAKSWVFMYTLDGRQREMGLGSLQRVPLLQARKLAESYRTRLGAGEDPIAVRDKPSVPTFGTCADAYIASHAASWSNPKHVGQWRMTLSEYAGPLRSLRVDKISTADVLKVLNPIWQTKPETASRVRGRIEAVLNAATAQKHRSGENPARWVGNLKDVLPAPRKLMRGHHAALPAKDLAGFLAALRQAEGIAPRALEFAILTAARSGEVMGAQWDEMDLDEKVWTVPAARMKSRVVHRVPLSERAIVILTAMKQVRLSDYVFPGAKPNAPLSTMAFDMAIRRLKYHVTAHGFRSTFRDWAAEETSFSHEVCEMALAHAVGSKVEAAYRRGDLFEKRRLLMDDWAAFCAA